MHKFVMRMYPLVFKLNHIPFFFLMFEQAEAQYFLIIFFFHSSSVLVIRGAFHVFFL